ncbi:MAG: PIN/TRAM domain-containing protein [Phycisphaerales bacterium]|nr:PIN/TRAM domain-containing protein [Phycisphaerales bacterium]
MGLIAGLLAAYALSFVVDLFALILIPDEFSKLEGPTYNLFQGSKVLMGLITCYLSISLVLQTKDDFRFVIPYVEFTKQIRGPRPLVLDTSVIIDGRILDLIKTGFVTGSLIAPKFVINELQTLADSADRTKRARGRRGLEILHKLQHAPGALVSIDDSEADGTGVDQKLINLSLTLQARLMTNDFNLAKVATLRDVDTLNLNDLATALRPVALPGEHLRVKIIKPGEGPQQGVGYLDDGTMIVVENGRGYVGTEVDLVVSSTLQTSAGRMIFGRVDGDASAPNGNIETDSSSMDSATGSTGPTIPNPSPRNPRRSNH